MLVLASCCMLHTADCFNPAVPAAVRRERGTDLDYMVNRLLDGRDSALILDAPVVQYVAAHDGQCRLFPVGLPFETFSLAMAFAPNFPTWVKCHMLL